MFEGVMLLWFRLAGISLLFSDRHPRHTRTPVLKWGFVLLTAYAVSITARFPEATDMRRRIDRPEFSGFPLCARLPRTAARVA